MPEAKHLGATFRQEWKGVSTPETVEIRSTHISCSWQLMRLQLSFCKAPLEQASLHRSYDTLGVQLEDTGRANLSIQMSSRLRQTAFNGKKNLTLLCAGSSLCPKGKMAHFCCSKFHLDKPSKGRLTSNGKCVVK